MITRYQYFIHVCFLSLILSISGETASSSLTPQRGIDIQKVMNYEMPDVIARYSKDHNVSAEDAKRREQELKRYFIMCAETGKNVHMLSKEVDDLWHTFLLFTKKYEAFCNEMFGHFIHHNPF